MNKILEPKIAEKLEQVFKLRGSCSVKIFLGGTTVELWNPDDFLYKSSFFFLNHEYDKALTWLDSQIELLKSEPVYEWQYIMKQETKHMISQEHFADGEFKSEGEKYEPSKRIRNNENN